MYGVTKPTDKYIYQWWSIGLELDIKKMKTLGVVPGTSTCPCHSGTDGTFTALRQAWHW